MSLRDAAQQTTPREQLLKELMDSRAPKTEREHAAAREIERLHAALADTQDWDEIEALRASLREHMAEIHRLRLVCRQALAELEKEARGFEDWLTMMQAARTAMRAALAEDALQQLTDVQQEMERVTDCHKKGRDKLSPLPDHIVDTNKMVAPVAYVTGFSKGYAVVQPVDRSLLMPVGMALYRSPPNQSEDALGMVEPVAYMSMCFSNGQTKPHSKTLFWPEQYTGRTEPVDAGAWGEERVVPLYTATPKREPLTDCGEAGHDEGQCGNASCITWPKRKPLDELVLSILIRENVEDGRPSNVKSLKKIARAIERAHGIGGEE